MSTVVKIVLTAILTFAVSGTALYALIDANGINYASIPDWVTGTLAVITIISAVTIAVGSLIAIWIYK